MNAEKLIRVARGLENADLIIKNANENRHDIKL